MVFFFILYFGFIPGLQFSIKLSLWCWICTPRLCANNLITRRKYWWWILEYRIWERLVTKSLFQQSLLYPYSPTVYVAVNHWTCGECNLGTKIFILFYLMTCKWSLCSAIMYSTAIDYVVNQNFVCTFNSNLAMNILMCHVNFNQGFPDFFIYTAVF